MRNFTGKKKAAAAVTAASIAGIITFCSLTASAQNSRGSFVLGSGEMAVYASDIDYLQSEINALFDEIPYLSGDPRMETDNGQGDADTENKNMENFMQEGQEDYGYDEEM